MNHCNAFGSRICAISALIGSRKGYYADPITIGKWTVQKNVSKAKQEASQTHFVAFPSLSFEKGKSK